MQAELDKLKQQRKQKKQEALYNLKQQLNNAQKALKNELSQNIDLNEKAKDLVNKESEQSGVLESATSELTTIQKKLKAYEETTRMKDEHSKFAKAVTNVQQAQDLTELTMLALKITEEQKRADQVNKMNMINE